jgi:hypothetical protein
MSGLFRVRRCQQLRRSFQKTNTIESEKIDGIASVIFGLNRTAHTPL